MPNDNRLIYINILKKSPEILNKIDPQVVIEQINDYNILLCSRIWIKEENKHIELKNHYTELILKELLKEKIKMPFETFSIELLNKYLRI